MVKQINQNQFNEVKESNVAVVDFFATWCGPCKMLGPVLEQLSEEMSDVNFFKVDVDDNGDLAQEFGITNIPAVGLLKNGELVQMSVGFKPKEEMQKLIEAIR
ncbi:MAG: thioredoxin [Lachnospiraceae bacterium]|nr:thioredoxin [Lachnospiraceae bacterium]